MKKIIHREGTKHKGGPVGKQSMPQKSGVALCGIKIYDHNKSFGVGDVNCLDCLKKINQ